MSDETKDAEKLVERLREIAQDWQGMTPADCTGEVLGDFLDRVFRAILADTGENDERAPEPHTEPTANGGER